MLRINNILHATDFSPCANQALLNAIFLANKYRAKLHLLHAVVLHGDYDPINPAYNASDTKEYYTSVSDAIRGKTDNILKGHDINNLDVTKVQERGIAPGSVILEYARENDMDLIVMGTHGRRGLGHLFLGSVAEEVVRLSECPVLTIREQEHPVEVETIERILVPLDFSEHSKSAIAHAKQIAVTYHAKIQLLHVFEQSIPPAFWSSCGRSGLEFMPQIEPVSTQNLKRMWDEIDGPEVPVDIDVVEGRAANDILEFAKKQNSDMIVMSTHGLTGILPLLLGSVTQKVVQLAKCPVFTVKAFGKSLLEG